MSEPILLDSTATVQRDVGDELIIKRQQFIPGWHLDELKREREDSVSTPAGEFHRVCSIPVAIADKWYREGFDINRAPIKDILLKLRFEQDGEAFITTKKRV